MDIKEHRNIALIRKIKDSALMNNPDVGELLSAFEDALKSNSKMKAKEKMFRKTFISKTLMFIKLFRQRANIKHDDEKKFLNTIISSINDLYVNPEIDKLDTILSRIDDENGFEVSHISHQEESVSILKDKLYKVREERKLYRKMAYIDSLTGVANRRFGDKYIHRLMSRKSNFSYIVIDIDHFKKINDRYGHCAGDILLTQASEKMKNIVGSKGVLCRTGGEEFSVIIREGIDPVEVSESIRDQIQTTCFHIDGKCCNITVSCGISSVYKHGESFRKIADDKLYEAKRNGRNQVVR